MTPTEQASTWVEPLRPGARYLKHPFIVRPGTGPCNICKHVFAQYDTKMVHVETGEFRCREHFAGDAYWGERLPEDPPGYLTYSDG